MMDSRDAACDNADSELLALLECLAEYQEARESSGALLRQGFFELALARRSAGYRWISPERHHGNARSTASVDVDQDTHNIRLVCGGPERTPSAACGKADGDSQGGVRQRRGRHTGSDENSDTDSSAACGLPSSPDEDKHVAADPGDPLLWFGVLVPPALRDAQGHFRAALAQLVRLAQLKTQLARLQQQAQQAIDVAHASRH
ncbi:hypothetical protein H4R19_002676 [Coemansia spiralis]|nr:hypothetical protein H4R19_002676 [Coemansia spiralis]